MSAWASVPLRDYWGAELTWHSARTLAGGGHAGLMAAPDALFGNPAALGFLRGPELEITYGLGVADEERTRIVYDSYEKAIGEVTVADNISAHALPGPAVGAFPFGRFCGAAGVAPARSFGYSYLKEYRDEYYEKIGEDRVEQDGIVYAASAGLAVAPFSFLSAGGRAAYHFGSRRLRVRSVRGTDTVIVTESGRPAGMGFGLGLVARPKERLAFGLDFESGVSYARWTEPESQPEASEARMYPWSARASVNWMIPGVLPANVSAEARYVRWHGADTSLSDLLVLRGGIEHLMLNLVRLRYGFGVEPTPSDPAVQAAQLSFGVGFDVGKAKVDLGAMFGRDVIGSELFAVPPAESDMKIYENRSLFAVSVSRAF